MAVSSFSSLVSVSSNSSGMSHRSASWRRLATVRQLGLQNSRRLRLHDSPWVHLFSFCLNALDALVDKRRPNDHFGCQLWCNARTADVMCPPILNCSFTTPSTVNIVSPAALMLAQTGRTLVNQYMGMTSSQIKFRPVSVSNIAATIRNWS